MNADKRIARIWRWYRRRPSDVLREAIVKHYWDYLEREAKRLRKRLPLSVEVDDLLMDGALGLLDAIDQYDPAKAKFETFSRQRLRGAMMDGLRAVDPISRLTRQRMRQLDTAANDIRITQGVNPTPQEMAGKLGVTVQTYARHELQAREAVTRSLSGRRSYDDENPGELAADMLADKRQISPARTILHRAVREAIVSGLSRSERLCVILYYYEDLTMVEIGQVLGLSEARISQMLKSIRLRLKASLSPDLLSA